MSFEPLPAQDILKIAMAVRKATELHMDKGASANEAMAEAAKAFDLNGELTKRAINMFNSAKTLAHFELHKEDLKSDFDVAKPDIVDNLVHNRTEKIASAPIELTNTDFRFGSPDIENPRLLRMVKRGMVSLDAATELQKEMDQQSLRLFKINKDIVKQASYPLVQLAVMGFNANPFDIQDKLPDLRYGIGGFQKLAKLSEYIHPDLSVMAAMGYLDKKQLYLKQKEIFKRAQLFNEPMDKAASEILAVNPEIKSGYEKTIDELVTKFEKLAEFQYHHATSIRMAFDRAMGDLINSFERKKYFDNDLRVFEKEACYQLGDECKPFILAMYKSAGYADREVKFPEVRVNTPEAYARDVQRLSEAMAAYHAFERESKIAEKLASLHECLVTRGIDKQAISGAMGAVLGKVILPQKQVGPVNPIPSPDVSMFIGQIENNIRQTLLEQYAQEFANTDPFLRKYDPDVIYSNLKEITEIVPTITSKKELLRAALTRKLEQGGRMDLDEVNSLLQAQKAHQDAMKNSQTTVQV